MKKTKTRIFDELKAGLEDSIAFSRGELSLVTTTMPAPPPKREPTQIADLRHSLRMSQAVFAAVINVSPKTVQSWEQGVRKPSQAALRMLEVMEEDPGIVKIIMAPKPRPSLRCRAGFAEPVR
jgi:putative transcriptional regulator